MTPQKTPTERPEKTQHYYSEHQKSPFNPSKIIIHGLGTDFVMYTSGGVFSPKKLDLGTKLIINKAKLEKGWKVLDLGCGYGIIGIALKKRHPSLDMVLTDINSRAVKLAEMNLKLHSIKAEVHQSDMFNNKHIKNMKFNTILINPPQTAGKKVCCKMIEESRNHLLDDGLLQIVVRHQKGGKELSKKMDEVFGNMQETAKSAGYRIYESTKKNQNHKNHTL